MASEAGNLFRFGIPADKAPVLSAEIRNNFEALARSNITSDTTKPGSPQTGMTRFNVSSPLTPRFEIYYDGAWIPLPGAGQRILFTQSGASVTWTIDHNMGIYPIVQAYDATGIAYATTPQGSLYLSVENVSDKDLNVSADTSGDQVFTGLLVSEPPVVGGYVGVRVNGTHYTVASDTTSGDCYFSNDGITAVAQGSIADGDYLYWNGSVAGFDLLTSYSIDFTYPVRIPTAFNGAYYAIDHVNTNRTVLTFSFAVDGYAVLIG